MSLIRVCTKLYSLYAYDIMNPMQRFNSSVPTRVHVGSPAFFRLKSVTIAKYDSSSLSSIFYDTFGTDMSTGFVFLS